MRAPLLKASYGLQNDTGDDEDSQPIFGLPFTFGKPLRFQRDFQLIQADAEPVNDSISKRSSSRLALGKRSLLTLQAHQEQWQQQACSPSQKLPAQQQLLQRRQCKPEKCHASTCRCCAGHSLPLGALASSLVQRGLSTAVAAEALAAVAAAAAAFEHVAAQPVQTALRQHAEPVSGTCVGDIAATAAGQHNSSEGTAGGVPLATRTAGLGLAVQTDCRSPSKPGRTVHFEAVSPGPGEYTLPATTLKQGPAFTMGARPAGQHGGSKAANMPGPGACTASSPGPSGPAFSIAGRWRDAGQEAAAPGPGEHQQLQFIPGGPAFSILQRPTGAGASRQEGNSSPGPGAYGSDWDNPTSPSGPAWSLGIKPRGALDSSSRMDMPGPGAYYPDSTEYRPDGPAYSFPAKSAAADVPARAACAGPAPGDYDPSPAYSHTLAAAPAFSMPKALLQGTSTGTVANADLPGPGYYYDPSTDHAGIGRGAPAFSIAGRPQRGQDGAVQWDMPGPGEYHREAPTDGPGFSITGRPTNTPAGSAPSDTPGPGHYNTASTAGAAAGTAASPAWTIAGRVNDAAAAAAAAKAQWPGPGDYDVTPQGPDGPAYSIQGKAKAAVISNDTPGPLDYCPDPTPVLPSAPCYSIAGRAASSAAAAGGCDSPGPGDYEVAAQQGSFSQGPAWTMRGKAALAGPVSCDGPGLGEYYRPQHPGADGPAFTLAGKLPGALAAADAALLPGPGYYEMPEAPGGAAFTIAGRVQAGLEQKSTPGPGAYLAPSFNDPSNSTAPAFTISGRPAGPSTDPAAALPGSGAYRAPELPKGPAYTLSGRQAAGYKGAGGQGPGPGAYDVTVGESGTPAWTIGARVADTEVSDAASTPAPGDYHPLPDLDRGPARTLAGRTATSSALAAGSSNSEQPGPGHYTLPDPQGHGPAFSIAGKASKAEGGAAFCVAADEPGPGAYFADKGSEGLAFTFRSKLSVSGDTGNTPGPGYYHKEAPAASGTGAPNMGPKPKAAKAAGTGKAPRMPVISEEASATCVQPAQAASNCRQEPSQDTKSSMVQRDTSPSSRCRSRSASDAGQSEGREAAPPVSSKQQLTLAQLNAQLVNLLKHKGSKQLRMQRYCLAAKRVH